MIKKNILVGKIIDKLNHNGYTNFLDQKDLKNVIPVLNREKIKYQVYFPYKEAEKAIVYGDVIPQIKLLKVFSREKLNHSDILGFLYNFQIDMDLIGDIIVDNDCYIICKTEISDYLIYHVDKIRNSRVKLEEVSLEYLEKYQKKYEEIKLLVSSLRIDSVVCKLTKIPRSKIKNYISDKNVFLNGEEISRMFILKEGDIFSIRRYGKYIFRRVEGYTKKNMIIILDKYI